MSENKPVAPMPRDYLESLKRDAVAGKLFQGGTIAFLVAHLQALQAEVAIAQDPATSAERLHETAKLSAFDSIEAMVLASEDEEIEPGEVWERVARVLRGTNGDSGQRAAFAAQVGLTAKLIKERDEWKARAIELQLEPAAMACSMMTMQEELERLRGGGWVRCEDQAPGGQPCLGFDRFYNRVGECEGNGRRLVFVDGQKDDCDITHWQPLPAPPAAEPTAEET